MTIVVDDQRQPKPLPMPILRLRPEIVGLEVIESNGDTSWAAWDSALAKLDGIQGVHE